MQWVRVKRQQKQLMNYLNKFLALLIILNFVFLPVFALELDMSVDEEIRKNYNPSKLELEGLPPLPNVSPNTQKQIPSQQPVNKPANNFSQLSKPNAKPVIATLDKSTAIRIKKGTKFTVKSNQALSDATREGTRISFTSQRAVTQTYITIPQGTIFKGEVADSHTPQLTGNGGLIVLAIDSMVIKGSSVGINAKITKAKHKKIFFNNIKGKHQYWKNTKNSLKPGYKFYKKMMRTTSKLSNGNFTVILTPFTVVAGVTVYAVNFVGAPLFGLFGKGGRIYIPAGSEFEIKILEDVYLY